MVGVDYHGEVETVKELFIFFLQDLYLVDELKGLIFLFFPHIFPSDGLLCLHEPELPELLELSALLALFVQVLNLCT